MNILFLMVLAICFNGLEAMCCFGKNKNKKDDFEFNDMIDNLHEKINGDNTKGLYKKLKLFLDNQIDDLQISRDDENKKMRIVKDVEYQVIKVIGYVTLVNKGEAEQYLTILQRTTTSDIQELTNIEQEDCFQQVANIVRGYHLSSEEYKILSNTLNRYFLLKRNKTTNTINNRLSEIEKGVRDSHKESKNMYLSDIQKIVASAKNNPQSQRPSRSSSYLPDNENQDLNIQST